jgi:uncharacterized glyoxalase superfamily protein PhnB
MDYDRARKAAAMNDEAPRLLRAAPYLLSRDLESLSAHYERVLGFTREYTGGNPPEFVIVSRDSLPIMLRRAAAGAAIVPNEKQGGTWDVFFWVRGLHALHAQMVASGANVVYGPTLQPYGVNEFAVRDVEGYVLGFGEPADAS